MLVEARVLLVGAPDGAVRRWEGDLRTAGATLEVASERSQALHHVRSLRPDAVLIDMRFGSGPDGFDTCRAIRSHSDTIIMLAACSDASSYTEVVALTVGADAFIVEGTPPEVVLARLRSLLRRSRGELSDEITSRGPEVWLHERSLGMLVDGDIVIDPVAREVRVAGVATQFTRIEFDLLVTLAGSPRTVFTHEQLLNAAWGSSVDGSHVLDSHLSRLRRKVHDAGGSRVAHAVRGVGYRLRP